MSNSSVPGVETVPLNLEISDKPGGPTRIAKLKVKVITSPEIPTLAKRTDEPDVSQVVDDVDVLAVKDQILDPPYILEDLAGLPDVSTELGQNVRAMVTNTVGFGWQLRERPMPEAERERYAKEIEEERFRLEAKLEAIHPFESLTAIRGKELYDKHVIGNGYLELIENLRGELASIAHVRGYQIKLIKKDEDAIKVQVPVVRPDVGFKIDYVEMHYRFRRYVVELKNGEKIWFKEAGDPRSMNKYTGEQFADRNQVKDKDRATSLIHNKVYHPLTPYGVPVYIGASVAISGSRASEEVNYNSIYNNMIPSMFVVIENGVLTTGSIDRLKEFTEEKIGKNRNRTSFIIIEGQTDDEAAPDPGKFRIKIEPLSSVQHNDQLYQEYDKNNREKVRQSFRMPGLLVGRSEDYTRSTSDNAKAVVDEQVFAPERVDNDHLFNRHVLLRWEARFHVLRSNHPNVTDDIELIRMAGIAERSGGMTPRRMDTVMQDIFGGKLGPLPKGVDLDVPFSISFAQEQSKVLPGGEQGKPDGTDLPGAAPVEKSVDPVVLLKELMDLRSQLEREIDAELLGR